MSIVFYSIHLVLINFFLDLVYHTFLVRSVTSSFPLNSQLPIQLLVPFLELVVILFRDCMLVSKERRLSLVIKILDTEMKVR